MDHDNQESPAQSAAPSHSDRQDRPAVWFPKWWIVMAAFLAIVVFVVRSRSDNLPAVMDDRALPNLITFTAGLLLALTWCIWAAFFSRLASPIRWIPLCLLLLGGAACSMLVRVDGVWGGMIPSRWSFVWTPTRDEMLEDLTPVASDATAEVDLAMRSGFDFPEFLGQGRRNTVEVVALDPDWQSRPPEQLWTREIGSGWSGFSAVNGYAVTLEQRGEDEIVACYDIDTGQPVWATAEKTRHETTLGGIGPRSTPTIYRGNVYALGATAILRCLDGSTGDLLWRVDLLERFNIPRDVEARNIAWGRAASPLGVDDMIVVPVGGATSEDAISLAAFDAMSGEIIWQGGSHQVSYASPILGTLGNQEQIIVVNESSVAGHDIDTGTELWSFPWSGQSNGPANVSQPWVLDDNRVLISKGYGTGCAVFTVERNDGESSWSTHELWRNHRALKTKFTNLTIYDNHAYGLDDGLLCCVNLDSGKRVWKRGRYGHGQILRVIDLLLVITEDGRLVLVRATPDGLEELASIQAIEGKTWNNLCLYGDLLLVRNAEFATCYRLPTLGDDTL